MAPHRARRGWLAPLALPLLLLAGAAGLRAQQPGQPPAQPGGAADSALAQAPDTTRPKDPLAIIREKLRRLGERPDTARDSTAVADSARARGAAPLAAPQPARPPVLGGQIEQDSIMRALAALPGFTPTAYSGDTARFAADSGRLVLKGPAQVERQGDAMTADSTLDYNLNTHIACGYGKPVLRGAGQSDSVASAQVCYDVQSKKGVAYDARTTFSPQDGNTSWYMHGTLYTAGNQIFGQNAGFTDCNLDPPHYEFVAKQVKMNRTDDVIVARNVTLKFADVPVFWLPFMMQSTKKGRHSGILMPQFDLNDIARTNANYQRRIRNVGFYWAINDHLGALSTLDWFSGNYTALNGAFDYNYARQFLNGSFAYKEYWQHNGSTSKTLSTNNSWRPDERTNMSLSASYASSSQFVANQSFDTGELTRSIDSNLSVQRRFAFGSLDLGAQRRQFLQNDHVSHSFPNVSLSLTPLTFFRAPESDAHFFNNLTWNGSANYRASDEKVNNYALEPNGRSTRTASGSFSSSFSMGKLSWSQNVTYNQNDLLARPAGQDTASPVAAQPDSAFTAVNWSTALSFQQRLIGTSSITPSLSISGQMTGIRGGNRPDSLPALPSGLVSAPLRMSLGAGTSFDIYGFWPGFGPFSRIRHKLSPSFTYSYSPAPNPDAITEAQRLVYGSTVGQGIREINTLRIGLSQTFEAKYKETAKDSTAADSTRAADQDAPAGEPRRLPQARKITLLGISNWAATYDFTADTSGRRIGFGDNLTLSTNVRSDLVPGLQFTLTHDVISKVDGRRHFSPYLTSATTSFSLSDRSWLFRFLHLSGHGGGRSAAQAAAQQQAADTMPVARPSLAEQASYGSGNSIVPRQNELAPTAQGGVGAWNASFNYSFSRLRPRPGLPPQPSQQMVTGQLSFKPTRSWSVNWSTGYNFSQHDFVNNTVSLVRDLHDWQAVFSFVKVPNGNFSVQFRVALKAQPDLKLDYAQTSRLQGF